MSTTLTLNDAELLEIQRALSTREWVLERRVILSLGDEIEPATKALKDIRKMLEWIGPGDEEKPGPP